MKKKDILEICSRIILKCDVIDGDIMAGVMYDTPYGPEFDGQMLLTADIKELKELLVAKK